MSIPPRRTPRLERGVIISSPRLSPVNEVTGATPSKVLAMLPQGDISPGRQRPFISLDETRRGGRARLHRHEDPIWRDLD